MIFHVYDQRVPQFNVRTLEYEAYLPHAGEIEAESALDAIKLATRQRMSRWPIVQRAKEIL